MKQQTAVEYLIEISLERDLNADDFSKALEIEKQQIVLAFNMGILSNTYEIPINTGREHYKILYNKTEDEWSLT